jgi:hypothetical protein
MSLISEVKTVEEIKAELHKTIKKNAREGKISRQQVYTVGWNIYFSIGHNTSLFDSWIAEIARLDNKYYFLV